MYLTSHQERIVQTILGPEGAQKSGVEFTLGCMVGLARQGDESIGRGVLAMAAEMLRRTGTIPIYLREVVADALGRAATYVERQGPTPIHVACKREGKRGNKPHKVQGRRAVIWSIDAMLILEGAHSRDQRAQRIAGDLGVDINLVRREMKARERWETKGASVESKADALLVKPDD